MVITMPKIPIPSPKVHALVFNESAAPVLAGASPLPLPLALVLTTVKVGAGVVKLPPSVNVGVLVSKLPPLVVLAATVPSKTFNVALCMFHKSHTPVSPGTVK